MPVEYRTLAEQIRQDKRMNESVRSFSYNELLQRIQDLRRLKDHNNTGPLIQDIQRLYTDIHSSCLTPPEINKLGNEFNRKVSDLGIKRRGTIQRPHKLPR